MQHTFDQKITARIAARNSPDHIRFRLTLRYVLLYLGLFVAGLLLCRTLHLTELPLTEKLLRTSMVSPLENSLSARDSIRAILMSARHEAILLVFLLLSGMTMFTESACGILLSLHGVLCGFFCYGSAILTATQRIESGTRPFFVCFFAMWAVTVLLMSASVDAIIFSYRYRDIGRGPRREREAVAVRYILLALTYIGTLAVIAAGRAWLLSIVS